MRISPEVFVGMPVFNGEKYMRGAIDSILAQDFTNFVLVISDNASTDKTAEIAKEYCSNDDRVKYHRHDENIGALENFRFLLDIAEGEYFMWAAVDDRWRKEFISVCYDALTENRSFSLAFTGMDTIDYQTGYFDRALIGFSGASSKTARALMRLSNPCANLVYGLQRLSVAKKLRFTKMDFWDVHWSMQHELIGGVITSNRILFSCGMDGKRKPYSVIGQRLSARRYVWEQSVLFFRHFSFLRALVLSFIMSFLIFKTLLSFGRG